MKRIIALVLALLMVCALLTGCGSKKASDATVYKIACDAAFPPFSIQNDDGTYTGIDVELIDAIAKNQGFQYELVPMDFSGIIPALVSGTIHGGSGGMTITEERKESVDFSNYYYESPSSLVINKNDDSIVKFEDLAGKVGACKEGTTGQMWCEDMKDTYGFTYSVYPDSASMKLAVANGQADFLIEDYPVIAYQIKIGEQKDLKIAVEGVNESVPQFGFSVAKGKNAELLKMLNDGLAAIKADGTYDKIIAKYE